MIQGFTRRTLPRCFARSSGNASAGSRRDYAEAVKAGPDRHQQKRILTFFRGDIPEEFQDLARELEVLGVEPSYREQQMAEVGGYSGGLSWGGDESPVTAEQLSTWNADEVVAFLCDWQSSERIESVFGLQGSLATYAEEDAPAALSVLNGAVEEGAGPSAIEGILDGLGEAAKAGTGLDWGEEALAGVGKAQPSKPLPNHSGRGVRACASRSGTGKELPHGKDG